MKDTRKRFNLSTPENEWNMVQILGGRFSLDYTSVIRKCIRTIELITRDGNKIIIEDKDGNKREVLIL